jgi:hypothetical protein
MDYNVNGQSGEQVLWDLETKAVTQAVSSWFERDPYIAAVYSALTPDDRNGLIEKVRADAAEAGFMQLDADKWLSHHVNRMYDQGKLPEIARAQEALAAQAQAQEDYGIQNAPMKQVNAYLQQTYGKKPAPSIIPAQDTARSKVMTLDQAIAEDEVRQAEAKKAARTRDDISSLKGWK